MSNHPPSLQAVPQRCGAQHAERLPLPPSDRWDAAQQAAAQALIQGPRGGVYGPFVPLLRQPALLARVAQLGESLRFDGGLPAALRELAICAVAQALGNQFEWCMHQPLALAAGVPGAALEALRLGQPVPGLPADQRLILDASQALLRHNGLPDALYAALLAQLGEAGVVELATLLGYFTMVSWLMNVAGTPGRAAPGVLPLPD